MANPQFPFQQLIDQQNQMLESWSEYSKKVGQSFLPEAAQETQEQTRSLFESWYKQQQDMAQSMFNAFQPKSAPTTNFFAPEQLKAQFELYQSFFGQYQEMLRKMGVSMPTNPMSEQYAQMGKQMENFVRMFTQMSKQWEPFAEMVQKGMNAETLMSNWMKPEGYQEMFDSMMSAMNMDAIRDQIEQMQKQYAAFVQQMSEGNPAQMGEAFGMKPWFALVEQVNSQIEQNVAPFTQSLNRSRENEMMRLMQEITFGLSEYGVKLGELMSSYYQHSYQALTNTVQESIDAYEKDPETLNYQDFFQNYLDQLEHTLTAAFETDAYAKLQNEVAKSSVQLKSRMDKVTELAFEGTPFTMRSHTEDVVAEVQELKRKVRSLERKLAEVQKAEAPANAKKTSGRSGKSASTKSKAAKK